jgi:peroxiredoxin
VIGVHTPETEDEQDIQSIREKAKEHELRYPLVSDNNARTWKAWGNTIWPSTYLIDKQGYIRYWWYGELNWEGAEGEKLLRERIEQLLAEGE